MLWVWTKTYQGKITQLSVPESEVPTRVVKQLKKLGIGLAFIRGHDRVTDEDMATLRRVTKDTCIPNRQKIIQCFHEGFKTTELSQSEITSSTNLHLNSARIECQKMAALGILEERVDNEYGYRWDSIKDQEVEYLKGETYYFKVSSKFQNMMGSVMSQGGLSDE